jgi:hypothetical protein
MKPGARARGPGSFPRRAIAGDPAGPAIAFYRRSRLPDAMCDISEEDFAEYLLWREMAAARAQAKPPLAFRDQGLTDPGTAIPHVAEQAA